MKRHFLILTGRPVGLDENNHLQVYNKKSSACKLQRDFLPYLLLERGKMFDSSVNKKKFFTERHLFRCLTNCY